MVLTRSDSSCSGHDEAEALKLESVIDRLRPSAHPRSP